MNLALLTLLACGEKDAAYDPLSPDTAGYVEPLAWDLAVEGPYRTGYRELGTTYTPAPGMAERTIPVGVWYPTNDTEGSPAIYTSGFPDTGGTSATSIADASLAASPWGVQHPVLVYSHGFQGYGGSSSFLMRHFASHGWIVVAPDHVGNTLMDHQDPLPTALYVARPRDVSAALDLLAQLPDADPLAGKADTTRVVLSGHSFGVFTTWSAGGARFENAAARCDAGDVPEDGCTEAERAALVGGLGDPRVIATIPLAGTIDRNWFGDEGPADIAGPVLSMTGSNDDRGQGEQYATMRGVDFTWAELDGGCHQTFGIGTCGSLEMDEGFGLVDTLAMAFARVHLLGDASAAGYLDGTVDLGPKVAIQHTVE